MVERHSGELSEIRHWYVHTHIFIGAHVCKMGRILICGGTSQCESVENSRACLGIVILGSFLVFLWPLCQSSLIRPGVNVEYVCGTHG